MTGDFIRRKNVDTETYPRRMQAGDEDRDQSEASTSWEKPRIANKPPRARREAWSRSSLTASEETNTANTLILDFQPPELRQYIFFFFPLFVCQVLFKFIYLFLFMAVLVLHFCARAFSSCGKRGPLFIVMPGPLTIAASLVVEHRCQTHRFSSCGSQAQLLHGMWDLPRPGLEPVSPALAGRFSTTAPPGKPPDCSVFTFIN